MCVIISIYVLQIMGKTIMDNTQTCLGLLIIDVFLKNVKEIKKKMNSKEFMYLVDTYRLNGSLSACDDCIDLRYPPASLAS